MKNLIGIFLMVFSLATHAIDTNDLASAGFNKLNDEQKANLVTQVSKAAEGAGVVETTLTTAERVVNISANIGKGLAAAAKELGLAVNDFAKTDVGRLTVALIIWNYIGGAILHVGIGLTMLTVGIPMIIWMFRQGRRVYIKYNEDGKIKEKTIESLSPDGMVGLVFSTAILFGVSLVTMITF